MKTIATLAEAKEILKTNPQAIVRHASGLPAGDRITLIRADWWTRTEKGQSWCNCRDTKVIVEQ